MTTIFGANIELSRCTATLTMPSCPKLDKSEVTLPIPVHRCFSNRSSAISRVSREVECRRSRKGSITYSVSGSNEDGSLTYKNAGVDIDAGSELVRRIAKWPLELEAWWVVSSWGFLSRGRYRWCGN